MLEKVIEIGEVKIYYETSVILFLDFGWYSYIFRDYTISDKQIEISPIYFLNENFNGSISNYMISLDIPAIWNCTILDADMKGYWSLTEVKKGKERKILIFISNSSKSPFAIIGMFDWISKQIEVGEKKIKLNLLLPVELREKDKMARTAGDILKAYVKWYGEYPYSFLQVVVSRTVQPHGGMNGIYGVILVSDHFDEWLLSHEIAHFWFGGKARFGTIDESQATFSSIIYFIKLSREEGKRVAPTLDSSENLSLRYNISLKEAYSKSLTWNKTYAIVYRKGAMVFRSLQFVLGNGTFFRGMRELLEECKVCSLNDIQKAFQKASNQDLDWFFKEWFYSAKVPDYEVTNLSYENHILSFEISDKNNLKMPVEIEVITPVKASIERVWVDGVNKTHVTFNIEKKPERIVIDPNEWIVNWNKEYSMDGIKIKVN